MPASKKVSKSASSVFLTERMVKAAYPFYNRPYEDDPGQVTSMNGKTVYRPNHGIAHGARSAALGQDMVDWYLNSPNGGEMRAWLEAKIKADPDFPKKFAMIALLHRSGRTDEADSIGSYEKRAAELASSANNFKKAVETAGVKFSSAELEDYARAIQLDGRTSENSDQSHMSRLLRAAHLIELLRIDLKLDGNISGEAPELSPSDIAGMFKREENYLNVTGDLRHSSGGFADRFYDLSTDPAALAQVIVEAQSSKSSFSDK